MKNYALNTLRLLVLAAAIVVGFYSVLNSWKATLTTVALFVLRNLFSEQVYDPIFKNQSAQSWAWSQLKKRTTRKRPAHNRFDV